MSILNFIKSNINEIYVVGKMLLLVKDLYTQPFASTNLDTGVMCEDFCLRGW